MVEKENKNVIRIIFGLVLFLVILYGTSPPGRNSYLTYIVFLLASLFVYSSKTYQNLLIGLPSKNIFKAGLFGAIYAGSYLFLTSFVPGLSIGVPTLPQAISDDLKLIIIIFIAPVAEEIFFRGGLLAYIREFQPSESKIQRALIIQAVLFAFAHLGAYIYGFYDYSSFTGAFSAINSNLLVFMSAGIFAYSVGFFVTRGKIKNLAFSIIAHMVINAVIFTKLSVIFQ